MNLLLSSSELGGFREGTYWVSRKVQESFRGGVVSVVRIPVRSDLSVHGSIYKRV